MTVLWALAGSRTVGWSLALSKVVAAEAAILNNFVWNDLWTFRDVDARRGRGRELFRRLGVFNLICLAGIGWSVVLLQLQVGWLGFNIYVANLIAIVLVSGWNFGLTLRFGWRRTGAAHQAVVPDSQTPRC
ncbi:MAG: GtrA family protein [Verrucomicrobiales bacterium]|nr:GtrA family protein [Verrucomicrobiales bacterium]